MKVPITLVVSHAFQDQTPEQRRLSAQRHFESWAAAGELDSLRRFTVADGADSATCTRCSHAVKTDYELRYMPARVTLVKLTCQCQSLWALRRDCGALSEVTPDELARMVAGAKTDRAEIDTFLRAVAGEVEGSRLTSTREPERGPRILIDNTDP